MKKLILIILLLFLSVWLGLYLQKNPENILLAYGNTSIEMPLWIAAIAILLSFFILTILLRCIKFIFTFIPRISRWSSKRSREKAIQQTFAGLIELAEAKWSAAEKRLLHNAKHHDGILINYLAAANAAQAQGASARREHYLRLAHKLIPNAKLAIELTQATLQIKQHQYEQALATLKHLREFAPHHPYILTLLQRLYLTLNDWENLEALLPKLHKQKLIDNEKLMMLQTKIYDGLLGRVTKEQGVDVVKGIWQRVPKMLKKNPHLIKHYANALLLQHAHDEAEILIREFIKKQWDEELISLYGKITSHDLPKQLVIAENLVKSHENNAALYLCLGRLSKSQQLWEKSRSYFEKSLSLNSTRQACIELGQLLETLNERDQALHYYREGLLVDQCY